MEFDHALQAKHDILRRVFDFEEVLAPQTEGGRPSFRFPAPMPRHVPHRRDLDPRAMIAVGVSAGRGGGASVALLCQTRRAYDSDYAEEAVRLARGEARKVYVGPIRRRAKARSAWRPARRDPLNVGASIGHPDVTAGTLGCFVDRGEKGICILSNNHVLANVNAAEPSDPILHPGRVDAGRAASVECGTLQYFVPINLDGSTPNAVDCAVAAVGDVAYDPRILVDPATNRVVGGLQSEPQTEVLIGMRVGKVGRTTGLTSGEVIAVEVDNLRVAMRSQGYGQTAVFDGQTAVASRGRQFSKGGDSGSIVWDEAFCPAGLLFAGSEAPISDGYKGVTFLNPIDAVLDLLRCTIFTGQDKNEGIA